jgi:hypothetical protein
MGEYDAIVVGVGIAVLGVAAILSKEAIGCRSLPLVRRQDDAPHLMLKDM